MFKESHNPVPRIENIDSRIVQDTQHVIQEKAYKTDQNSEDYEQVKEVITFQHIILGSWIINEFENLNKYPGQAVFESYLPKGKAGIQLF